MRNLRTLTLVALLAAMPTVALAQGGGGGNKQAANKQAIGQANFGNLISALNNIAVEINELKALNNLTIKDVQVVNVSTVLKGNNVQALNNALNRNETQILSLRNVLTNLLNNNTITVLSDAFKNNKVDVGQVVAIDVLSGGDVTLFVQPK